MTGWRKRHITNTENPIDFPTPDIDKAAENLARYIDQMLIDQLREASKAMLDASDTGYEESTHEKQAEFAKKRNYPL